MLCSFLLAYKMYASFKKYFMQGWFIYAIAALLLFAAHDITLKYVTNTNSLYGTLIVSASAFVMMLVLCMVYRVPVLTQALSTNTLVLVFAGFALGLATFFLMLSFKMGAPVSMVIPLIYIGIIVISIWYGYLFFKEQINFRHIIGSVLALAGLIVMFYKNTR